MKKLPKWVFQNSCTTLLELAGDKPAVRGFFMPVSSNKTRLHETGREAAGRVEKVLYAFLYESGRQVPIGKKAVIAQNTYRILKCELVNCGCCALYQRLLLERVE